MEGYVRKLQENVEKLNKMIVKQNEMINQQNDSIAELAKSDREQSLAIAVLTTAFGSLAFIVLI